MIKLDLVNVGEIRFGPAYHELYVDGLIVKDKLFGRNYTISEDEKYAVFQEWLSIDYSRGPFTRVFLINLIDLSYYELSDGKKGFVENFSLNSDVLNYELSDRGKGTTRSFECELDKLKFRDLSSILGGKV